MHRPVFVEARAVMAVPTDQRSEAEQAFLEEPGLVGVEAAEAAVGVVVGHEVDAGDVADVRSVPVEVGGMAGDIAVAVGVEPAAAAVAEFDSAVAAGSGQTEVAAVAVGVAPVELVGTAPVATEGGLADQDSVRHTERWVEDTTAAAAVAVAVGAEDIAADAVADAAVDAVVLEAGQVLVERATETVEERSAQREGVDMASPT